MTDDVRCAYTYPVQKKMINNANTIAPKECLPIATVKKA